MAQPVVHGRLIDLISGEPVADTEDERLRQQIARRLLTECGFSRQQIECRRHVPIGVGEKRAEVPLDFLVSFEIDGSCALDTHLGPSPTATKNDG